MLQPQSAILECVAAARDDMEIHDGIQALAQAMDWVVLTLTLDLQAQWPCRRNRWWALLLPKQWHSYGLHPWPATSPYRVVGDIFKCWGHWTDDDDDDETDLQLFEYEFLAYSNPEFGGDKRLLEFSDVANTFLHSYGNALMSCPCNCRQSGFSRQFLERKGLRGCFVQPRVHHNPRYLHPRELGLLLGLPNSLEYPFRPREHLFLDL